MRIQKYLKGILKCKETIIAVRGIAWDFPGGGEFAPLSYAYDCGYVVLESVYMAFMDEDWILDQRYEKQIISNERKYFYMAQKSPLPPSKLN